MVKSSFPPPRWMVLASLVIAGAVLVAGGAGMWSLSRAASLARASVEHQLDALDDARGIESLLLQRGLISNYLLTRDIKWLALLEQRSKLFRAWLAGAKGEAEDADKSEALTRLDVGYSELERLRQALVNRAQSGDLSGVDERIEALQAQLLALLDVVHLFEAQARSKAVSMLAQVEVTARRMLWLVALASLLGLCTSVAAGYLLARRIGRPVWELQVQIQAVAARKRFELVDVSNVSALGAQVAALVRHLDETDATLVQQRERLAQSEKLSAIGELAAKLAHQILNPVAGIKAAVQLLARRATTVTPKEIQGLSTELVREVARVEQLLQRLTAYARPFDPLLAPTRAEALVSEALELVERDAKRWTAVFHSEVEPALPLMRVDALLMRQAISNLLSNAAEAMAPAGGRVSLKVTSQELSGTRYGRFEVTDEGPGMTTEQLKHLFQPFYTTKAAGHGLGLAVAHNIATVHGGRLTARNRPDARGALFELLIPLGGG